MTVQELYHLKILLYKNKDNVLFSFLIEEILRDMQSLEENEGASKTNHSL